MTTTGSSSALPVSTKLIFSMNETRLISVFFEEDQLINGGNDDPDCDNELDSYCSCDGDGDFKTSVMAMLPAIVVMTTLLVMAQ